MNKVTVCFTGHRIIPQDKRRAVITLLDRTVSKAYEDGYRRFLCGGALGFDTLAALRILEFRESHPDLKLILVVPCGDQHMRWCAHDRNVYNDILDRADDRIILSPAYYKGCMQTRNRYMVDHSSLCICYLYSLHGGTAYTVRYALSQDIPVINLAMEDSHSCLEMRESQFNSMFISHFAEKNADTVRLRLSKGRNLTRKDISGSC